MALVHGGGKAIARLQERLRLEPHFVEGLRVTDDESLDVAEMVLSGLVNKRLVGRLVAEGIPAVGLSGVDNGLISCSQDGARRHTTWAGWATSWRRNPATVEALLAARGHAGRSRRSRWAWTGTPIMSTPTTRRRPWPVRWGRRNWSL